MKFNENNSIWLMERENPNELIRGRIVVTNGELWKKTMLKLQDIGTYIEGQGDIYSSAHVSSITPVWDGEIKTSQTKNGDFISTYYFNPRCVVYNMLQGQKETYLSELFSTLERKKTPFEPEMECASTLLRTLEESSLDGETIKTIVQKMWPNFGFYATEGLDCTTFEALQSYNIEEMLEISNLCEKNNIAKPETALNVYVRQEIAKENSKVLSLARKANVLSKR